MPRKYKIKRKKKSRLSQILPESMQAFLARRIIDGTGVTMALSGAFILIAIISYNAQDPSFNSSGGNIGQISNWLGSAGATLSDILLQTLGLAAIILGVGFAVWGYRILKRLPMSIFWGRLAALF
ncbi:MAG: DNA translocase FtsK 4TM domain-containing protein, partial [Pseudomonadota bacterium]